MDLSLSLKDLLSETKEFISFNKTATTTRQEIAIGQKSMLKVH